MQYRNEKGQFISKEEWERNNTEVEEKKAKKVRVFTLRVKKRVGVAKDHFAEKKVTRQMKKESKVKEQQEKNAKLIADLERKFEEVRTGKRPANEYKGIIKGLRNATRKIRGTFLLRCPFRF